MVASAAMRGAPRRAAVRPSLGPRRALPQALPVAAVVVAAVAVLAARGSDATALLPIGGAAVLVAVAALVAAALRATPLATPGAAGLALLAALAAHAAWSGATIAWSIAPDRSWEAVNRTLAYLALLGVGMLVAPLVRSPVRAAAAALAGVLGFAILWSLLGKVVPALGDAPERSARLTGPLDYWNALALAIALALPLWLWFASGRFHRPEVRAAAVAALSWSVVTLLLTGSRGGILAAAVAVAVWFAVAGPRLDGVAALALSLPVGGAIGVWALTRPGLAEVGASSGERARDGALLGLLLLLGGAAVVAAALAVIRWEDAAPLPAARRRALVRAAAVVAALLAAAVAAVVLVRSGGPGELGERFRNPPESQLPNDPSRYVEVASNHRWTWWNDAWEIFEEHRLGGTGAGSYELARRPIRDDSRAPLDPHNLAMKALSETGLVGFLLVLAIVGSAAWIVAGALRRLTGAERSAAAALAAGAAAWLVHSLVDMTWELAAVTAPVLLALGVLAVARRPAATASARRPFLAAAAVALGAGILFSLAAPPLAERRLDLALDALTLGRAGTAIELARDAQELNPLAVEPLHLEAAAYEATGRLDEAETLYVRAVELQPQNAVTWFELGRFEYEARENLRRALFYLDRAWGLDPWARETGRLLDAVRAELAAGG